MSESRTRARSGPIGVLALQGAFAAHARALEALGHATREVRVAADLDGIDGLVLPGGESTAQLELVRRFALAGPLAAFAASGAPILATCAGLILAARSVIARPGDDPRARSETGAQPCFGWLDVSVARNAYGRQVDSFEAVDDSGALALVLIRAPRIVRVGPDVRVLATLRGEPVLVREGNVVGATFHPELTSSLDTHRAVFGPAVPSAAQSVDVPRSSRERELDMSRSA